MATITKSKLVLETELDYAQGQIAGYKQIIKSKDDEIVKLNKDIKRAYQLVVVNAILVILMIFI